MRRLTYFLALIFVLVGGTLGAMRAFDTTWEPRLRRLAETRLSQAIGGRVEIESISPVFIHRLRLDNVRVYDSRSRLLFRAASVSLTVSLLDLPHAIAHRHPLDSIGLISIEAPWIQLTPELLRYRPARAQQESLPLLFTLAWNGATVQYRDPAAPHGAWTLYQSRGLFRIRGPRTVLMAKGSLEQAQMIRLDASALGKRWNAQAAIKGGDLQGVITLVEHLTHRRWLPEGAAVEGGFQVEASASGRKWPTSAAQIPNFIREARFTLASARLKATPTAPPIEFNGGLLLQENRLSASKLAAKVRGTTVNLTGSVWPFGAEPRFNVDIEGRELDLGIVSEELGQPGLATGSADARFHAEGTKSKPVFVVNAKIPSGTLRQWPVQDAVVEAKYLDHHWEFINNSAVIWGGKVTLKGFASKDMTDLQITGDNLQLAESGLPKAWQALGGRLNFSGAAKGPLGSWTSTGSLWMADVRWGGETFGNLQGNFEFTPERFEALASSQDSRFRLDAEGRRSPQTITIDRLTARLPSGASAAIEGTIEKRVLKMTVQGNRLQVPGDVPALSVWVPGLAGTASFEGSLEGTLDHPVLAGRLFSQDLKLRKTPLGDAKATLRSEPGHVKLSDVSATGLQGDFEHRGDPAPGWSARATLKEVPAGLVLNMVAPRAEIQGTVSGEIDLRRAATLEGRGTIVLGPTTFGRFPMNAAKVVFETKGPVIEVMEFTLQSPSVEARLQGKASFRKRLLSSVEELAFDGTGKATSGGKDPWWEAPLRFEGLVDPNDHWRGEVALKTDAVRMRQKPTEPVTAKVRWEKGTLRWQDASWGLHWDSAGSWTWTGDTSVVTGRVNASRVALADWVRWLWPENRDVTEGLLTGTLAFKGAPEALEADFKADVTRGRWRGFLADGHLEGHRKGSRWEPLILTARLADGGDLVFRGALAEAGVQGTLQVTDMEARPLSQSLSFPRQLEGPLRATLTVKGPLRAMEMAGHLEGGPLTYGSETAHPVRVEHVSMDAALAPSPEQKDAMRLRLVEGVVKTAEEQIRFNPGSFAEFAGRQAARMHLGTEIRNLHLGLFTLFGGLDLRGTWQIKPEGFSLQGDAYTRSLFINDYELEEGRVHAAYYNGVLRFESPPGSRGLVTGTVDFHALPQLNFTDFSISGKDQQSLAMTGTVGPKLWDFKLAGSGLDLGTLGGLAGFPYPLSGTAHVGVRGTGDPTHPHLEGNIELDDGRVLGLTYQNGKAHFIWQDDRITFTQLALAYPGRFNLLGTGVFPLTSKKRSDSHDKKVDFSVRLEDSNLGLLQCITPEVKQAKGSVQGLLQVTGTSADPQMRGSLRIEDGDVVGAHYFRRLRDIQLTAEFEGDKLIVRELRGRSGEGQVKVSGNILFSGFEPNHYDLRAEVVSSKGLEVQVPELAIPESPLAKRFRFLTTASRADVKGHVTFKGPAEAPVFAGLGEFTNGHFTFPPPSKAPPPASFLEWIHRVNWDVELKFNEGSWFENELVEASLVGSLRLKGPSDRLRVDGGMDINAGKISYLGLEFDIDQARFDIRPDDAGNAILNIPFVRGIAVATVQAVDTVTGSHSSDVSNRLEINDTITLTIDYAPVDQIKPRLSSASNPNLTQEKLLARVTQLDAENLSPQERNYLYQQQMVRLIDTSLATPLARNILKRTGLVDRLSVSRVIDPTGAVPTEPVPGQANPQSISLLANTKYTFEKNLGNRLSLGYGVRFIEATAPDTLQNRLDLINDVELSYRAFKNVFVRGTFDLPNSNNPAFLPERKVTIEPRWRFGWWGNTNKEKMKSAPAPSR